MQRFVRARRGPFIGAVAFVLATGAALPAIGASGSKPPGAAAKSAQSGGNYIVQLKAPPVASYRGGTRGLPATSPRSTGRKLANRSAAVRAYRSYLAGQQRAALARLGGPPPRIIYSYRTVFAGFAARLTPQQVNALRRAPEVARVTKDVLRHLTSPATDNAALDNATNPDSAAYLDLPEGIWQRLGGSANAGDGVIVGVIDGGIEPGHPSFADTAAGNYTGPDYTAPPDTWEGTCEPGMSANWSAADCNNKLIGARYFVDGFGIENLAPGDSISPRDDDGHGSNTASIAAGNFGVDPSIDGNDLGVNRISGIAPRARVAAYKVCWIGAVDDGCFGSDSLDAIEAATNDGVDVINYSVGSDTPQAISTDSLAFLGATDAGVFVASSAGNAGPDAGTVGDPSSAPWIESTAAATNSRRFAATATIADAPGPDLGVTGASANAALATPTPLIDSVDAGATGADADSVELCEKDTLDPAKVAGKVVLCLRGSLEGRIAVSKNVFQAGAAGMILYNPKDPQDLGAYPYWLPAVQISHADGLLVKQAIADPGSVATATIGAGSAGPTAPAVLAAFSSRGPQTAVPDISKPDLTAPGVNILGAAATQTPPSRDIKAGRSFQVINGTSQAGPHVAGAAALLTQMHPTWSTAALKSALMTTADLDVVKKEDGTTPATPLDAGSGQLDPSAAADPGLVVDAGTADWVDYLEVVAPDVFPPEGSTIQPRDLNLPSISNHDVPGATSMSRTFTSVDDITRRWTVEVQGLPGITATPSVTAFTIKPGQTQTIDLDFLVTTAPVDEYQFGALVLTSPGRSVRLPISLQPTKVSVPDPVRVSTDKASGSQPVEVETGYNGQLSGAGYGLAAPDVKSKETIDRSPSGGPDPAGAEAGTKMYRYEVPAGSQLFLSRLENVDTAQDPTDLDLYVYRDANNDGKFTVDEIVDFSASGTSKEQVTMFRPPAGHYGVEVVGFDVKAPVSVYDLVTAVVTDATGDQASDAPSITVGGDPKTVAPGDKPKLDLQWSNVNAKGRYFGVMTYHEGATPSAANRIDQSVVELTQTAEAPQPGGGGGAPGPTPPGPPAQPQLKLKLSLTSAKLKGRTLTLRLRTNKKTRIRTTVSRSGRKLASAKLRTVFTKTRTLHVRLNRKLKAGRTYTVRIAARSGSRLLASDSVRLKVRKKK